MGSAGNRSDLGDPAAPGERTQREVTPNTLCGRLVQLLGNRLSPNDLTICHRPRVSDRGDGEMIDIERLPRGGPNASWLDRMLQTDRLEYLDRDDIADDVKEGIHRIWDRLGRFLRSHDHLARITLAEVSDVTEPRILELGAGPGALSRRLLELSPCARTTVTDIDPVIVAKLAATQLGSHPRATVRVMDATAIDAPDNAYDLAVLWQRRFLPKARASRESS
jgi:SAM-dependent methyltransferase